MKHTLGEVQEGWLMAIAAQGAEHSMMPSSVVVDTFFSFCLSPCSPIDRVLPNVDFDFESIRKTATGLFCLSFCCTFYAGRKKV